MFRGFSMSGEVSVSARTIFVAGSDAYDDRPRRDRNACSNAFDAMEPAAKIKNDLLHATSGQTGAAIEPTVSHADTIALLLLNRHYGQGMTAPVVLSPHEVDLIYLGCVGGGILLTRTP
jgi:hypothetical protein